MDILEEIKNRLSKISNPPAELVKVRILVYVKEQRAYLLTKNYTVEKTFKISTAKNGVGAESGSGKTPPGFLKIYKKIGTNAVKGAVFKDRINTGEVWDGESKFGDLILSRILLLTGMEKGVNLGGNLDTKKRYIYFHGTSHIERVGKPASHGCITLKCDDIIDLFNLVKKGDIVLVI